jgi:hypothetical protein
MSYKIGVTKSDIMGRVRQLQTGNPYNIEVMVIFKSKHAFKVESYLHKYYGTENIRNEWFSLDAMQVGDFANRCGIVEKMFCCIQDSNTYVNKTLNVLSFGLF